MSTSTPGDSEFNSQDYADFCNPDNLSLEDEAASLQPYSKTMKQATGKLKVAKAQAKNTIPLPLKFLKRPTAASAWKQSH